MSKVFTSKKTHVTLSEVNVIPLVDIVFTLLIIFMILAPVIHKGIDVQVPESSTGEAIQDKEQYIVSITKEGTIWFNEQEISLETLPDSLQHVTEHDTIYVQSDTTIPYGTVVEVISAIKEQGIRQVGLVTTPRVASSEDVTK
ncbi:hypothetical protein CSA56_08225 [candidate division KSB3 bacterium]|uniref:Biopolymer transporter ExbD n=1 Tax=candidate division KSB3 bacterium TaxID=2044937 RepID=A0A2G6KFA0_9BACT|nr:MAG: hypothetical protein CSA56_08225 [candidate division KSB3 bacterium]